VLRTLKIVALTTVLLLADQLAVKPSLCAKSTGKKKCRSLLIQEIPHGLLDLLWYFPELPFQ